MALEGHIDGNKKIFYSHLFLSVVLIVLFDRLHSECVSIIICLLVRAIMARVFKPFIEKQE